MFLDGFSLECHPDYQNTDTDYATAVSRLNVLEDYAQTVQREGMSREYAVAVESMFPKTFDPRQVNRFTVYPSATSMSLALEAFDFKRTALLVSIISAGVALLYKFFEWLLDLITSKIAKDIVDAARVRKAANKVKSSSSELEKTYMHDESYSYINTDNANHGRLSQLLDMHCYSHKTIMNYAIQRICDIGVKNNYDDRSISSAVSRFISTAGKLNIGDRNIDDFGRLCGLLLRDKFDALCPAVAVVPKIIPRQQFKLDVMQISRCSALLNAIVAVQLDMNNLTDQLVRPRPDVEQIRRYMSTSEQRIYQVMECQGGTGTPTIDIRPNVEIQDNVMQSVPTGYVAEINRDVQPTIDFVREQQRVRVSIWDQDIRSSKYTIESPDKHIDLIGAIVHNDGMMALAHQAMLVKDSNLTSREFRAMVNDIKKTCKVYNNNINKLKGLTHATFVYEYNRLGSRDRVENSPIKQLSRMVSLSTCVQTNLAKVLSAFASVDIASSWIVRSVEVFNDDIARTIK